MIQEFKNKTITIVDDEEEILNVVTDLIKSYIDINVVTFTSAVKAIENLKNGFESNIFISDIKMPKMNGIEFITKLKKLNIKKPIIIISGHAEKTEAIQCLRLGAFNLIDKPITFEIFIHAILQALRIEEISINNEILNQEKENLIHLFHKFTNKSEERISEVENLILEKTKLIQSDKFILKRFLERINECNKIDREITKTYKEITNLLKKQNSFINNDVSQEFFETYFKENKKHR